MKYTWKEKIGSYTSGKFLSVGGIRVGEYSYNGMLSKTDPEEYRREHQYQGSVSLPGLTGSRVYGRNEEIVKYKVESLVTAWFKRAEEE